MKRSIIVRLDAPTASWIAKIEAEEGIPPADFVHEAVSAWSLADADLRRALALRIMHEALRSVRPD